MSRHINFANVNLHSWKLSYLIKHPLLIHKKIVEFILASFFFRKILYHLSSSLGIQFGIAKTFSSNVQSKIIYLLLSSYVLKYASLILIYMYLFQVFELRNHMDMIYDQYSTFIIILLDRLVEIVNFCKLLTCNLT